MCVEKRKITAKGACFTLFCRMFLHFCLKIIEYRQKEMITALFNSGFETAFTTSDSTTSLSAEMPY